MAKLEVLKKGFKLGEWDVLPLKGVLRRAGEEVRPAPKVMAVLLALAQRNGDLVTKDELVDEVWDGRATGDEPILQCISLLRGHLHDKKPFEYVGTLQRRGYRLLKRVEPHRSSDALPEEPVIQPWWRNRGGWITAAAVVAIGFVAVTVVNWPAKPTPVVGSLAIMPIENLSGNDANQYIVDGIKNALAHRLSGLPELTIKNSLVSYPGQPSDIAASLNVESVLTGAMQLQGKTLMVTWLVSRGDDNVTIGSGEITGKRDEVFEFQERFAFAVRRDLFGKSAPQLITHKAPDSSAYNSYMRGMYVLEHREDFEAAVALFKDSIRQDESYGPAYLALAESYALMVDYEDAPFEEYNDLALTTVEAGIDVDPGLEDSAGMIYGYVHHMRKEWQKSEEAYERAIHAPYLDSNTFNWYSRMLASVGRFDDALVEARRGVEIDPNNIVLNGRVATLYTWLGDRENALEYFGRVRALGSNARASMAAAFWPVRDGDFDAARNFVVDGVEFEGFQTDGLGEVFAAMGDPLLRPRALEILDYAEESGQFFPVLIFGARVLLGDLDGAMAMAQKLEEPGEYFETELLLVHDFGAIQQHPDFMPLLGRLGVVDYWSRKGCVWSGGRVSCPAD